MGRHIVTFGSRFARERHPFFGDCPALPGHYGIVLADDYRSATRLVRLAFGDAWWALYIDGPLWHAANDIKRQYPHGQLFLMRPDELGQPIMTFPAPGDDEQTTTPAIYVGSDGYAKFYEDRNTGPLDPERAAPLTRVPLPATVEDVQPRDIVAAERKHRAVLTERQQLANRIDYNRQRIYGQGPIMIGAEHLTADDYAADTARCHARLLELNQEDQ